MEREIKARLSWVKLYLQTGNAGLVCQRCGISRPTLRKWIKRYHESGLKGLNSSSRKPARSPTQKVFKKQEKWILNLRNKRKMGARRIQNELLRLHDFKLSLATIHKILKRHKVKPLQFSRRKKTYKRYSRPIPGDRIQMDTCKIAPGMYQYTAIDDCTRYQVLGLFPRRNASNTLMFLEQILDEVPFPIQRIQTDRGREFFARRVQECLLDWGIKFRPIKPGSPHLNGKVERAQRTDLEEFYAAVDLKCKDLEMKLSEWQHYYNWCRPHGSLNGKTPMDKFFELIDKTPCWDDVEKLYDQAKERIQNPIYQQELALRRIEKRIAELKRCP